MLRGYAGAWFRGAVTSPRYGNVLFGSFTDTITLGPIRLAIGLALPVLGVLIGNWIGHPRLAAGLGLGAAMAWVLMASCGLGFLGYLMGASPLGALVVGLGLLTVAAGSIYWVTYLGEPPGTLSWQEVGLKSAAVLVVLDALGAYDNLRTEKL